MFDFLVFLIRLILYMTGLRINCYIEPVVSDYQLFLLKNNQLRLLQQCKCLTMLYMIRSTSQYYTQLYTEADRVYREAYHDGRTLH